MSIEVAAVPPSGADKRYRWAAATCVPMADGSAVLVDPAGVAHALNPEGAAVWRERPAWTVPELEAWLAAAGCCPEEARAMASSFLEGLTRLGLAIPLTRDRGAGHS